jgi:hypothetical protein
MSTFLAPVLRATVATLVVAASAQESTLDLPFGRQSELPSPDGQHILYREQPGMRDAPELWLRHRGGSGRRRLLQLGSTARAFWFPDSRNLLVIDRESSSGSNSYIYDANGSVVLDIRIALFRFDRDLKAVDTGHFYVEAQHLLDAETVRIAAFGHTDQAPVRCFRFIYKMNRGGKIERLSKRISPATATACDEQSE